jgi:hypothetical protein
MESAYSIDLMFAGYRIVRSKFFSYSASSENAFEVFDKPSLGESFSVRVSSVLNYY